MSANGNSDSFNLGQSIRPEPRSAMTLLELLVVLFILSAIAFSAVAIADRADEQFRFDETSRRLTAIRLAIVGSPEAQFSGQSLLSGFVTDVGRLPAQVDELVTGSDAISGKPLITFGLQTPIFDPMPDANGFCNFSGEEPNPPALGDTRFRLFKGFRGPYLRLTPGSNRYRDAWGTVNSSDTVDDRHNHGWRVAAPFDGYAATRGILSGDKLEFQLVDVAVPRTFAITSVGSDGAMESKHAAEDDFQRDMPESILASDWGLPINAMTVTVTSHVGAISGNIRVSLLVYVDGNWLRFTSADVADGIEGYEFHFIAPAPPAPSIVPIGEHILVAIYDPDGIAHTPDDTVHIPVSGSATIIVAARVKVFPRSIPNMRLTIR